DTHLVFDGVITYNNGANGAIFVTESHGVEPYMNPNPTPDDFFKRIEALKVKRIFKYPAWQHLGEYAD
ncbi:MAG TPA: hypothetical protein VGM58_08460, partial [Verrucomicrobiae bacterium]